MLARLAIFLLDSLFLAPIKVHDSAAKTRFGFCPNIRIFEHEKCLI